MLCVAFCKEQYIGETKRCARDRFSEHQDHGRNLKINQPLGKHMAEEHPEVKLTCGSPSILTNAKILAREPRSARRFIREAIEIRDAKPTINTSAGWQLD